MWSRPFHRSTIRMWHVPTNVAPWSSPDLAVLDARLRATGSLELPGVDAGRFALEADGLHYTRAGQVAFTRHLVDAVVRLPRPLLILSDSTIDHHNWDDDGNWTGWANALLVDALRARGVDDVVVDAVRGTGFVAGADSNQHFRARLSRRWRTGFRGAVLMIGGWNDEGCPCADAAVRGVRRWTE